MNVTDTDNSEGLVGDDFVLKISRPQLTQLQEPSAEIARWLEPGWNNVDGVVKVKEVLVENWGTAEVGSWEFHFDA